MPRGKRSALVVGLLAFTLSAAALAGLRSHAQQPATPAENADVKLLQAAGLPTDPAGLMAYFRNRTLKEADRQTLEALVKKLDAKSYREREAARRELMQRGPLALRYLREGMKGGSLEMVLRAEECIRKIETDPASDPARPAAAARVLAALPLKDGEARAAATVLMDFLAGADDEWLEDEVLGSLAVLAERRGQLGFLAAALQDRAPERRGAAGHVVARRGTLDQRKAVRQLLDDPVPAVRTRVAIGLVGRRVLEAPRSSTAADESQLRAAGVSTDGPGLLEFFRKRSLDERAQQELNQLIRQLGSRTWSAREQATRKLVEKGPPAIPFLLAATESEFPEIALRASRCIDRIKQGPGPGVPIAAARLLACAVGEEKRAAAVKPADAVQVLLTYVPFADNESVEDEVIGALTVLSVRDSRVDPVFRSALHDALPARRAAAAYVLGRAGTGEDCQAVQGLLRDPLPRVRLRAAQGLLAAREKAAVPALIDLFGKAPDAWRWRVEELLYRVAGDRGPDLPATADAEGRRKAVAAWADWWRDNESRINLARAVGDDQRLGLTLIVEYDSTVGNRQGKVWECGRDGNPRWAIKSLFGAMDAQVLPGGRILIAENNVSCVSERDLATGKVIWQHTIANPVTVQRLPGGNTFIATYNTLVELDAGRKVVYTHNLSPNFFVFGARKLRNGHVVAVTSQGMLVDFDMAARRIVRTVALGSQGNWCGVDVLPNGNYLVALMNPGEVREIDAAGKIHWSCRYQGVFRATRLPNGNTLAVSMTTRTVAELDRAGTAVWSKVCEGRPWAAHAR